MHELLFIELNFQKKVHLIVLIKNIFFKWHDFSVLQALQIVCEPFQTVQINESSFNLNMVSIFNIYFENNTVLLLSTECSRKV